MGRKLEEPLATEMATAAEPWTRQTWNAAHIFFFVGATELDQLSEFGVVTVDLGVTKHWVSLVEIVGTGLENRERVRGYQFQ